MDSEQLYEIYGIKKARTNNEKDDTETPVWITSLPESVYSTAIISPLWTLKPVGCNFETFFGIGILWSLAYLCILIQSLCIYFVNSLVKVILKTNSN